MPGDVLSYIRVSYVATEGETMRRYPLSVEEIDEFFEFTKTKVSRGRKISFARFDDDKDDDDTGREKRHRVSRRREINTIFLVAFRTRSAITCATYRLVCSNSADSLHQEQVVDELVRTSFDINRHDRLSRAPRYIFVRVDVITFRLSFLVLRRSSTVIAPPPSTLYIVR